MPQLKLSFALGCLICCSSLSAASIDAVSAQPQSAEAKESKASAIYKAAEALAKKGDIPAAIAKYREAAAAYKNEKSLFGELLSLVKIANFDELKGEYQNSLALYQQILSSLRAANETFFVGTALNKIGFLYTRMGNPTKGIEFYQESVLFSTQQGNPKDTAIALNNLSIAYTDLGKVNEAEDAGQKAVQIYRKLGNKEDLGAALSNLGEVYNRTSRYDLAIKTFEESLVLRREIGDRVGEATTSNNLSTVYAARGDKAKAKTMLENALAVFRQLKSLDGEASALNNLGFLYDNLGEYDKALDSYQQALSIRERLKDIAVQAIILNNIAAVYAARGQYERAVTIYERVLKLSDRPNIQATTLGNLALAYRILGNFPKSIETSQKVLEIRRSIRDRAGEALSLSNLGNTYQNMGQFDRALALYAEAIKITEEIGDKPNTAIIINNIAQAYGEKAEYAKQIDYLNRALEMQKNLGNPANEGTALNNLGVVYKDLGQYVRSISFFKQALELSRKLGDRSSEGIAINNLAAALDYQDKYFEALSYYQQAEVIFKETKQRILQATVLGNIGLLYNVLKQNSKAIETLQRAQAISLEIGDRLGEGANLNNLGRTYRDMGNTAKSLENYQSALAIFRETGKRDSQGIVLSGLATTLKQQNQIELAILFFKQSVNLREAIRKDLTELSKEDQGSYRKTIANSYRSLAALLLQTGRVIEGLQVLDLLKVQELQDYLRDVQGNDRTAKGIELLPEEVKFTSGYSAIEQKVILKAREIAKLRESQKPDLGKLTRLEREKEAIATELMQYLKSKEVSGITQAIAKTATAQNLETFAYKDLQTRLRKLESSSQQKIALFYPLILEDRLELVLFFPNSPPVRHTVNIKQADFEAKIREFRSDLLDPSSQDVKASAIALHKLLIAPLNDDLQKHQVSTILYAPDRLMRYVPLGALYDDKLDYKSGKGQWLAERFQINYISAINITDFETRPRSQPNILAGAFSQGEYTLEVNGQKYSLRGLEFAGKEVSTLGESGKAKVLFNSDFGRNTFLSQVNSFNILHLATHAAFVNGSPENSFIMLGNGEYISLREIKNLNFANVSLVVLSACQTALGGELGNGDEILGFGYQMQRSKAQAAIASLWSVSDGGTQFLMNGFYRKFLKGDASVIQALSNIQSEMIRAPKGEFTHPYYWAAFITIGNGM